MNAPICIFVYSRLSHTQKTISALKCNYGASDSEVYIFSDGPRNDEIKEKVDEVREYLSTLTGFAKLNIIKSECNKGLARSIVEGVTAVLEKYNEVIVVEDDLITSPYFLQFMNDGLSKYRNDEVVASIHGYVYPKTGQGIEQNSFFLRGADCWGWATWKRAWNKFEPDGKLLLEKLLISGLESESNFNNSFSYSTMLRDQIDHKNDSWAVRWYYSAFLNNMLTLYPRQSFVTNIGMDSTGTHCSTTDAMTAELVQSYSGLDTIPIVESKKARENFEEFFLSLTNICIREKIVRKLKRYLSRVIKK